MGRWEFFTADDAIYADKKLLNRSSAYDALPLQLGLFEIKEQSEFETDDGQITYHLREVRFVEGDHDLWIHNQRIIHDQIRDKFSYLLSLVTHRELLLLIDYVPAFAQLDHQCVFIKLLVQARLERVQNLHCCADDIGRQNFVGIVFSVHAGHINVSPQMTPNNTDGRELFYRRGRNLRRW